MFVWLGSLEELPATTAAATLIGLKEHVLSDYWTCKTVINLPSLKATKHNRLFLMGDVLQVEAA